MQTYLQTYLFRAFHGGYTGGVCVAQGKNIEDAIDNVILRLNEGRLWSIACDHMRREIDQAYYAVFPKKDCFESEKSQVQGVKAERFENPKEEWQKRWNTMLPFPEKDMWLGGKGYVIYQELIDTLPYPTTHISFGTWKPWDDGDWTCERCDEHCDAHCAGFRKSVRKELESCTFQNGRLILLEAGFVVLQGGGT